MNEFAPDWAKYPRLCESTKTKRELAGRASHPAAIKLVREAYQRKTDKMQDYACLYVVGPDTNEANKIGIAHHPFSRLSGIQVGCWKKLSIRALFWYPSIEEAARHEAAALKIARKEKLSLCGEWVDLDFMEAIGLVLTTAEDRRVTDTYGLILEWFPELKRQKLAHEDAWFEANLERQRARQAARENKIGPIPPRPCPSLASSSSTGPAL